MVKKMTLTGTLLKWGNSYGIRVSKEDVFRLNLCEKQEIEFDVKPLNPLQELWDASLSIDMSKEDIKKIREEMWESKWGV